MNPCSLLVLYKSRLPPSLHWLQIFSQSRSLTKAEALPTNTPALGSRNHLDSSPRTPVGTFSKTNMTISVCQLSYAAGYPVDSFVQRQRWTLLDPRAPGSPAGHLLQSSCSSVCLDL